MAPLCEILLLCLYTSTMSKPYIRSEYMNLEYRYTVYDHTGAVMISTASITTANQYLAIAHKGISARVYRFLEYYNWQIPRRYLDWL